MPRCSTGSPLPTTFSLMSERSPTTPLYKVLVATFLASVSGGAFWSAIFFVTANAFAFSAERNLALASMMGVAYTLGASFSGWVVRKLSKWMSPRSVVIAALLSWAAFACIPLGIAPTQPAAVWVAALGGSLTSSVVWPIMESYMSAGRHGASMRRAVGRFNLTWTPAVAVPLLFMPLVARWNVLATVALCAVFNALSCLAVRTFSAQPGHHDAHSSSQAVGANYVFLARATMWMLPVSYAISSILSPVLPSRLSDLHVPASVAPLWAATWMLTRFVALGVLWQSSFWHGRWWPLLCGAASLLCGAALVLMAPVAWVCALGLACFGCGLGIVYYASLYYSLAVGQAQVDAGGKFEALVGLGYIVGPGLGLAGFAFEPHISANVVTLGLCLLGSALACIGPLRAFRASVPRSVS